MSLKNKTMRDGCTIVGTKKILEKNLMYMEERNKESAVRQDGRGLHSSEHVMFNKASVAIVGAIKVVVHSQWNSAPTGTKSTLGKSV